MDIEYWEEIPFAEGMRAGSRVSLREGGADRNLFRALGESIPPGGHMMVSYEGDQRIQEETLRGHSAGVPPDATPLGLLLFLSGFPLVKDWYLAEGGMEGPRKLWGEKAPDAGWERTFRERTLGQLLPFLALEAGDDEQGILPAAKARAEEISRIIGATG